MYPFSTVLVNCGPHLRELERELTVRGAPIEAAFPDAATAADELRRNGPGRLFILKLSKPDDLWELQFFTRTFPRQPIVALVDLQDHPQLLVGCMRAGAMQVVPTPIQPDDLHAALDCLELQFGESVGEQTNVIAVTGVAGGCGATTIAIHLACEAARQGAGGCVLLDLALNLGSLTNFLDIDPTYTTADLLGVGREIDSDLLARSLTRIDDSLSVLSGPDKEIQSATPGVDEALGLIGAAKPLANFLVLDVPSRFDELHLAMLSTADHVLLVGQQNITSARPMKLVRSLLERERLAAREHVIINRYDPARSTFSLERLRRVLDVPEIVTVANDPVGVACALNEGQPLHRAAPRSPILTDVARIARRLLDLPENHSPRRGLNKLLRRMFRSDQPGEHAKLPAPVESSNVPQKCA
jgi:pilus assembly protein CpaE